jgi:hypothetical protein
MPDPYQTSLGRWGRPLPPPGSFLIERGHGEYFQHGGGWTRNAQRAHLFQTREQAATWRNPGERVLSLAQVHHSDESLRSWL